ncbi:dolichyldiphosphatase 1-like [Corticium candelabrum]|uniref:dolichyldiphosphatase 1-like n=1 Tax=Corticium candelabrum TaxID=121492 RepID=UPI002E265892|nr:dolichyldiphosphatase 1-like [Corticium candelabrum]
MAGEEEWVPLTLTFVEYPKGDLTGKCLAAISLTPVCILVGLATLLLLKRDLHTMAYFFGLVLNEAINFILKHIVQESRPTRGAEKLFTEYGMPSSHAQFMGFFAVYFILFIYIRIISQDRWQQMLWKCCLSLTVASAAVLVACSRVYLQYHTVPQVVYGLLIGVLIGTSWFVITHRYMTPLFAIIASWQISEFLMIRDCSRIPDIMWFEYTAIRKESRLRERKTN